jgi:hypothetical protein
MQIGIEDSGDNLLTIKIGSMIKGYAAAELFIAGNVTSGHLSC